ncbi:hypothetical protein Ciccas_006510 [Cichlidogyrus casuarinus]|uniref:ceramide glucosyltransferase n=1 Tax=Cichlidogyrus casuarinus TaxID=1844966 RepID=A0ABD2Q639_9PLAT
MEYDSTSNTLIINVHDYQDFSASRYSIQYDNILANSYTYLDLFLYIGILIIGIVCTGLLIFHFSVILFSRIYLYRFTFPQLTSAKCSPDTVPSVDTSKLPLPGITIIKPLTGVDEAVITNLRSFFYLDYPRYEILFCVSDPLDPVIPHVEALIKEHSHSVDACLLFSDENESFVNPKINNMNPAYLKASYDYVLISDVGIYMYPNTLSDMVITMLSEENVGLVHQIPFLFPHQCSQQVLSQKQTSNAPTAWVHQLVYFGCWHAKMYMGAAMLGINCTTGMSCLMRKRVLDSAGGLAHFGQYLAEDFFFSKYFYDNGWKVRVASQPAWQHAIVPSIKQFQDRMLRWYQLRLAMVPVASLLELFSGCFINGIVHAFCYAYLFPYLIDPVAFFFFHVLIWFMMDFIMLHQIHPPGIKIAVSKVSFFAMWALYESTSVFTQFRALFTRDIHWRGKRYRLEFGGRAHRLLDSSKTQDPEALVEEHSLTSFESAEEPMTHSPTKSAPVTSISIPANEQNVIHTREPCTVQ